MTRIPPGAVRAAIAAAEAALRPGTSRTRH